MFKFQISFKFDTNTIHRGGGGGCGVETCRCGGGPVEEAGGVQTGRWMRSSQGAENGGGGQPS
jgi:hypothetical protein